MQPACPSKARGSGGRRRRLRDLALATPRRCVAWMRVPSLGAVEWPLDHAVLLRTARRDRFLFKAVAANQRGACPTGEDQPVVGSQKERLRHLAERAEPADQGMFERAGGCGGLSGLPRRRWSGCDRSLRRALASPAPGLLPRLRRRRRNRCRERRRRRWGAICQRRRLMIGNHLIASRRGNEAQEPGANSCNSSKRDAFLDVNHKLTNHRPRHPRVRCVNKND